MFTAAFVHCMNDTWVFEYDRLICVTWRQTEQQNICRCGRWSGRFSLLPAPFPLRGPPAHAPPYFSETRSPLHSAPPEFWPAPLHSAPFSAQLTCSAEMCKLAFLWEKLKLKLGKINTVWSLSRHCKISQHFSYSHCPLLWLPTSFTLTAL